MAVCRWALLWLAPTLPALRLRRGGGQDHGLVVLTTATLRDQGFCMTARSREVLAAIGENLAHASIAGVHLLFEGAGNHTCADVPGLLSFVAPDVSTAKLKCADIPAEPMYKDLLDYANRELAGSTVALVNADTVFDESLHGMMAGIAAKPAGIGYVLSVVPPTPDGAYSKRMRGACGSPQLGGGDTNLANDPRCVLGAWDGARWGQEYAGDSWDGFIFTSPLPAAVNTSRLMDVPTHILGAENRVAYELVMNGHMVLYNPCKHIRLQHWHCRGGKAHGNFAHDLKLLPHINRSLFNIFPCWDCPGLAEGYYRKELLCEHGTRRSLPVSQQRLFRHAYLVQICCAGAAAWCSELDLLTAPLCQSPGQTDCVLWESDYRPVVK